jgi:hypothetical protein
VDGARWPSVREFGKSAGLAEQQDHLGFVRAQDRVWEQMRGLGARLAGA